MSWSTSAPLSAPQDSFSAGPSEPAPERTSSTPAASSRNKSIFSIPPPIKALFDQFPLTTYPSNVLPPSLTHFNSSESNLYVTLAPNTPISHDPSHLKIQTYLSLLSIPHTAHPVQSSAYPAGAIPFLIPANQAQPIRTSKLLQWADSHAVSTIPPQQHDSPDSRLLVTTMETALRLAYLYALIQPPTFAHVAHPASIAGLSSVPAVQAYRAHELKLHLVDDITSLAQTDDLRHVDASYIFDAALQALDTFESRLSVRPSSPTLSRTASAQSSRSPLRGKRNSEVKGLCGDEWGYADAVLFAYVHCILTGFKLEGPETWAGRLWKGVKVREGIVGHWRDIRDTCFGRHAGGLG